MVAKCVDHWAMGIDVEVDTIRNGGDEDDVDHGSRLFA